MSTPSGYGHMNYHMRDWMSMLISDGCSFRKIGRIIGRHHTTISREFYRNADLVNGEYVYDPKKAHAKYKERFKKTRGYKLDNFPHLRTFIGNLLDDSWSPEVISGFLKKRRAGITISHEAIYQYIYKVRRDWISLLCYGLKRRRRKNKYKKRTKTLIPCRISIDKRPKTVEKRNGFGHFEVDTMVTRKSKEAVLIILERKTRLIKIRKLKRKTAEAVKESLISALQHYKSIVKSITYDNGTENVLHQEVNEKLESKSFFCNPYHSWEKGSVENSIGLLRRFIPKGSDLSEITESELKLIERKINSRPRKILDFNTPRKEFNVEWCTYD